MQFPLHGNYLETTEVVSMQFPLHGNLVETTEVVSMKGNHVETRWKLLSGFHALETIWKLSTCRFRMVSTGFPFHGNSFFRAVHFLLEWIRKGGTESNSKVTIFKKYGNENWHSPT